MIIEDYPIREPRINTKRINSDGISHEVINNYSLTEEEIVVMNEIERINKFECYGYMVVTIQNMAEKLEMNYQALIKTIHALSKMGFIEINKNSKQSPLYHPARKYKELYKERLENDETWGEWRKRWMPSDAKKNMLTHTNTENKTQKKRGRKPINKEEEYKEETTENSSPAYYEEQNKTMEENFNNIENKEENVELPLPETTKEEEKEDMMIEEKSSYETSSYESYDLYNHQQNNKIEESTETKHNTEDISQKKTNLESSSKTLEDLEETRRNEDKIIL